jgi:hypothetical protein
VSGVIHYYYFIFFYFFFCQIDFSKMNAATSTALALEELMQWQKLAGSTHYKLTDRLFLNLFWEKVDVQLGTIGCILGERTKDFQPSFEYWRLVSLLLQKFGKGNGELCKVIWENSFLKWSVSDKMSKDEFEAQNVFSALMVENEAHAKSISISRVKQEPGTLNSQRQPLNAIPLGSLVKQSAVAHEHNDTKAPQQETVRLVNPERCGSTHGSMVQPVNTMSRITTEAEDMQVHEEPPLQIDDNAFPLDPALNKDWVHADQNVSLFLSMHGSGRYKSSEEN